MPSRDKIQSELLQRIVLLEYMSTLYSIAKPIILAIEVEVASTANNLLLYFSSGYILRPLHTHEYLGSLQMTHLADS